MAGSLCGKDFHGILRRTYDSSLNPFKIEYPMQSMGYSILVAGAGLEPTAFGL